MARKNLSLVAKAKIMDLARCVGYRAGSVVSKVVVRNTAGNVTLFSFDTHEGLSEHVAPFDALVCMLDGEAKIRISDKTYRLKSGQSIILPANKPHALEAVSRFKMMLVMIKK